MTRPRLFLPREHGGWFLFLVPLAVGLGVAWQWNGRVPAFAIAALALFLCRQPLDLVTRSLRGKRTRDDLPVALAWLVFYGALAGLAGGTLLLRDRLWGLAPLAIVGAGLLALHLVAGTRVDPPLALARLRARGQVVELRLADLRFTVEETTTFLNDRLGLDLAPDEVGILHAHTEGWALGLRLLVGSLSRLPPGAERQTHIRRLAGSHRHVFDFLTDEVLDQQEPEIRTFLVPLSYLQVGREGTL